MGLHDGHRQRKKEQFLQHGLSAFADHEALELLLFYAIPRQDVNPTAHLLLEHFGSLEAVLAASTEELEQIPGVGRSAAALIRLVPQLVRRAKASSAATVKILDTTERIGAFFLDQYVAQNREVIYLLCLDAKGRMLGCHTIGEGDVASAQLQLRSVVEIALRSNAVLAALAHNHPSGVAFPSQADRIATGQIKSALETIGVTLVDHIVVADDDYISFRHAGLL